MEKLRNQNRALIIGAGPSVWLNIDQAPDFDGVILVVDRMLVPCIQKGIIPDYIISIEQGGEAVMPDLFPEKFLAPYKDKIKMLYTHRTLKWVINHFEKLGIKSEKWDSAYGEFVSNVGLQCVRYAIEKLHLNEIVFIGFNHTEYYKRYINDFNRCVDDHKDVKFINCTGGGSLYLAPIIKGELKDWLNTKKS